MAATAWDEAGVLEEEDAAASVEELLSVPELIDYESFPDDAGTDEFKLGLTVEALTGLSVLVELSIAPVALLPAVLLPSFVPLPSVEFEAAPELAVLLDSGYVISI